MKNQLPLLESKEAPLCARRRMSPNQGGEGKKDNQRGGNTRELHAPSMSIQEWSALGLITLFLLVTPARSADETSVPTVSPEKCQKGGLSFTGLFERRTDPGPTYELGRAEPDQNSSMRESPLRDLPFVRRSVANAPRGQRRGPCCLPSCTPSALSSRSRGPPVRIHSAGGSRSPV